MHSIEITNVINSPEHEDLTADQVARNKAEHWIRLGVTRALEKAQHEVQECIDEIQRRPGSSWQEVAALEDLAVALSVLRNPVTKDKLTASAWHRRAGGASS